MIAEAPPAAEKLIAGVKRRHASVVGVRPDGVPYEALDPELIGWVHTCIPWAVMTAFERYNRPLSPAERDSYLREQAVIGRRRSGRTCRSGSTAPSTASSSPPA